MHRMIKDRGPPALPPRLWAGGRARLTALYR